MNLLLTVIVLQVFVFVGILFLLLKRPAALADSRLAELPTQLTRLDARSEALDNALRVGLSEVRREANESALANREAGGRDFVALRSEITGSIAILGDTLRAALAEFRTDNNANAAALAKNVQQQLEAIGQRLGGFVSEANRSQIAERESLNTKLNELSAANGANLEKIRVTVEERLERLNVSNAAKLEEMRVTVDEKLHATLQDRLTESFGQVTTHLGEMQKGLGEMKVLATGVDDLKKVLSNVTLRGSVGQFLVEQQLKDLFSPEQYLKQANIKPHTAEVVDYALKFPNGETGSFVLLPIDSKFPISDWERLEHAYDRGTTEEIAAAGRGFERAIRTQAKSICDKYIDPPTTMPCAIMVLPTEGLYAEVLRRPGLQYEIQSNCRVTIAGPSTFRAILTSFQMGFHTMAIQKKGDEVWRVLSSTKNEFEKFGDLMGKMESQVGTVQNTIQKLSTRSRAINRTLRHVTGEVPVVPVALTFDDGTAIAPLLAAGIGED